MRSLLFAGLAVVLPLAAHAQIVIQTPAVPGVQRVEPNDYWRHQREGEREVEWQRRDQYREEAQQHQEWVHNHCVRDWQNQEYCRR